MLKIAIAKGHLFTDIKNKFEEAGIPISLKDRCYTVSNPDLHIKLFKSRDIPFLIENNYFDIGFTGNDWIFEFNPKNVCTYFIGDCNCKIISAIHKSKMSIPKNNLTVVSEYPNITKHYLHGLGISEYTLITNHGTTEAYMTDVADMIVDNYETGNTLVANDLKAIDIIFQLKLEMIVNKNKKDSLKYFISKFVEV